MLNQWAEIVLRNLAWTGGWVVAAVLLFLLVVAVLGGSADHVVPPQGKVMARRPKPTPAPPAKSACSASRGAACPRCARRDEAQKARRIAYFESVLKTMAVPDEPRRSRRVGPPNPRAGEPARERGCRVDVTA